MVHKKCGLIRSIQRGSIGAAGGASGAEMLQGGEYNCGMAEITPEQARAYLGRWELVRKVEADALRSTPVEAKLRQLAALMASRHVFGSEPDRQTQADKVRERWAAIRKQLGG
jgi:hypothetical protein